MNSTESLAVARSGIVSLAFYDRRLTCPAPTKGSVEDTENGIGLDQVNANWSGTLPPYGAAN